MPDDTKPLVEPVMTKKSLCTVWFLGSMLLLILFYISQFKIHNYISIPYPQWKFNQLLSIEEAQDKYVEPAFGIRHTLNSLWPKDAICQHIFGSILVKIMVCSLKAQSHYLSQFWFLISEVLWHAHENNFTASAQATNLYLYLFLQYLIR